MKQLPEVSVQTIKEITEKAAKDKDELFQAMAIFNPTLYTFIYDIYKLPRTDKEMMLGLLVGMYHMLERQAQLDGLLEISEEEIEQQATNQTPAV